MPPNLGTIAPKRGRSDSSESCIIRGTAVWRPTDDLKVRLKLNLFVDERRRLSLILAVDI